ncbi:cell differentiation protein rcd1-like isoform X1 [Citrus sinensis]|uniref:cell differentiation protein rcd1-like isoform X1 n=1 Tax=Citrus sinensis TaxID=2711 RepID=UPI0022774B33|nr:cell differentiation protein rcd1-like isoform X1 [Citrus sinensis]
MASDLNLPESLYEDYSTPDLPVHGPASVAYWIQALQSHETKERALLILSQNKEIRKDLAPLLWNSIGTISALLQEIISVYRTLSSPNLTETASTRVSNALALFQCVASHPETRKQFLKGNIYQYWFQLCYSQAKLPLYLYPFLNTKDKEKPHEYLRLTSLGVIGTLVKSDDPEAIRFLLQTEIFPCCLTSMEVGSDLSKQVATFIIYKILLHEEGLKYCCVLADRFFAVARALAQMTEKLVEQPSPRLLKHIICCYHRLSQSPRACDGLRCCLPLWFGDRKFTSQLHGDFIAVRYLQELLSNIMARHEATRQPMRLLQPMQLMQLV